ncbi:metal-sensitive transcriptional regulator [Paenarthrobacter sp. DKR-5]|uniref:metal-sensitive transcriptional regulator n=1 Tax=Paenarthrobacter sp. DKR-5 TaxID=2835535 RepID=UPI001BDD9E84|nr:metal-sensitive transcriptional regulator [Paenarthrobacter sp. DKR-5]MBT1004300.1 metal-sensitive transcriptional regulator [Paenarthrobacter sp. DKR-5]
MDTHHTVSGTEAPVYGYSGDKAAYQRRMNRIEGQVRGIARMIDEDKYCIDILTQISAVTKALHAVSIELLEEHISHCVVGAANESAATGDPAVVEEKVREASAAISRLLK